jgi:2-polyprenyl-6-methoxyphenol hydroxylase-like FAD-dependent oxidoreductase
MARRVAIIGAGIGGLTAAAALARRGWEAIIYERANTVRAIGSGIYLFENGLRVLEALGALERAVAGAHWGCVRETRDKQNHITAVHRFNDPGQGRVVAVVRQRLMDALLDCARQSGAKLVLGAEAVAARPAGNVRFADGAELEADLVIAADGVNSRLRESLALLARRRRTGDGAIRVMIERTEEEKRSEEGQKFIEYWSGMRRVLYTPCDAREVYLALTCTNDDPLRMLPLDIAGWSQCFPHLATLFARIGEGGRWDPFEVVNLKRWSEGRVALLGDSAHAMAPNLGQGGGTAMMGGLSIAHYLDRHRSIEEALKEWETQERPLVEHTQRMSSFLSAVTFWPEVLRNTFFSLAGRSQWFSAQRWRTARHAPTGLRALH